MKENTYKMIELALKGDGDVSEEGQTRIMEFLHSFNGKSENAKHPDRILKGTEVAKRLGLSSRTIRNYRKQGLLHPFCPKGRANATGYLESDVNAFLATHGVPA